MWPGEQSPGTEEAAGLAGGGVFLGFLELGLGLKV